jgi:hypothetical protein
MPAEIGGLSDVLDGHPERTSAKVARLLLLTGVRRRGPVGHLGSIRPGPRACGQSRLPLSKGSGTTASRLQSARQLWAEIKAEAETSGAGVISSPGSCTRSPERTGTT